MKIWEEALTEYDIEIRKKLVDIRNLLNEHKDSIHMHWFGENAIHQIKFQNSSSKESLIETLLKPRAEEIYSWFQKNGYEDIELEDEHYTALWQEELLLEVNRKRKEINIFEERISKDFTLSHFNLFELSASFINHIYDEKSLLKSLKYRELIKIFDNGDEDNEIIENAKKLGELPDFFLYYFEDMEDLSLKLAKQELLQFILKKYSGLNLNLEETLKIFHYDFFHFPVNYFPGKKSSNFIIGIANFFNDVTSGGLPDSYLSIRNQYEESTTDFILNGQFFLSYNFSLLAIVQDSISRFGNIDVIPFPFLPINDEEVQDALLGTIQGVILMRIELFFSHFDDLLFSIRNRSEVLDIFPTDQSLIEYLIKYYKSISDDRERKIIVFRGLKLPSTINKIILECLILICKFKLDKLNGRLHHKLILPPLFESIFSLQIEKEYPEVHSEYPKIDFPFFSKEKIIWSEEKRQILEKSFSYLYLRRNKNGVAFMEEAEVWYLLKANFSCYDAPFEPKSFKFNGTKVSLRFFMHQIYDVLDGRAEGNILIRFAQLLVQNIALFYKEDLDEKKLDSLKRNIKNKPPAKGEFFKIDKDGFIVD